MKPIIVAWDGGGQANIVRMSGDEVWMSSSEPLPPGARLEGSLESGERVRLKIHGSKKTPEGHFDVRGRFVDLRRELREKLARLLG